MAFPAFLDTFVRYPAHLCDILLRLAELATYMTGSAQKAEFAAYVRTVRQANSRRRNLLAALDRARLS